MSRAILCDGCMKTMYADSRSRMGDYHELMIDQTCQYHVCRNCYDKLMNQIFHLRYSEDFGDYIEEDVDNGKHDKD